ncbi:MAG: OadG family protein [Candidatus Caldatribacteriota bacterium]
MFKGIIGGIQLSVIDMLLVFSVLGLLALVMYALKYLVKPKANKKPEETKGSSMITSSPVSTVKEEQIGEKEKLVAIVSAAVACLWGKPGKKFRVLSIRRMDTTSMNPWTAMGRQELMLGKNVKS